MKKIIFLVLALVLVTVAFTAMGESSIVDYEYSNSTNNERYKVVTTYNFDRKEIDAGTVGSLRNTGTNATKFNWGDTRTESGEITIGSGTKVEWLINITYTKDESREVSFNGAVSVPTHNIGYLDLKYIVETKTWVTTKTLQYLNYEGKWVDDKNFPQIVIPSHETHKYPQWTERYAPYDCTPDTTRELRSTDTYTEGKYYYPCISKSCNKKFFSREHSGGCKYTGTTCTKRGQCSCGRYHKELGHDYKNATCTLPQLCSRCGASKGNPKGHVFQSATCTKARTCSVCGAISGRPKGHSWGGWQLYQTPTATNPGKLKRTCSTCGTSEFKNAR